MASTILLAPSFLSLGSSDTALGHDFTRYDGYINTLAVIYHSDQEAKSQTQLLPAQPTRQDVGNNPAEIRPEFGNVFGQADFSGGALQEFFHHPGRDDTKYLSSEGFNPTERGALRHLNAVVQDDNGAIFTDPGAMAQANGFPWVINTTRIYRGDSSFPATWTPEDPTGGGTDRTLTDLASSGTDLYIGAEVDGVWKRDAGGTYTNHVTGATINVVAWAKDRLMVADTTKVYEITAPGALPAALETLAPGWTFTDIFEAGRFIIATAFNLVGGLGRLHVYGLNTGGTALEKKGSTGLPKGDLPYVGLSYLGRTLVGGGRLNSSGGYDPLLYEVLLNDDGALTLVLVNAGDGAGASDLSIRAMESLPDTIVFGWCEGRAGLGAYHLARNAFYFHLKASSSPSRVNGVILFKGRLLFSVDGDSTYFQNLASPVLAAELVTSVADWNNYGFKTWDLLEVNHDALVVGTSVKVDFTKKHPDESEWEVGIVSQVPGEQGTSGRVSSVIARRIALRLSSTATATAEPVVRAFGFRSVAAPTTPDWQLVRHIRLVDRDRKDKKAEPARYDPRLVRAQLQNLAYTWVTLYEAGVTWEAFVQGVADMPLANPMQSDASGQAENEAWVVQLTLIARRAT